jgi:hypothetical protein
MKGNLAAATSVAEEALAEARAIGSVTHVLLSFLILSIITSFQGDLAKAKGYCFDLLAYTRENGGLMGHLFVLFVFGFAAIFSQQPERGVCLLAASEAFGRQRGIKLNIWGGPLLMVYKQALETAQAQLDPGTFEAALQEGRALTLEQALALATENNNEDSQLPRAGLGSISH